jgi:hypothetical protein
MGFSMSDSYAKLFTSITESTIWQEPASTRLVWITMLALKRRDGIVYASVPGLASRANVPLADAETALACLLGPDPYSRTKEHEGRRIEPVDGGWLVLNAAKFDKIRSVEERREYMRKLMADKRALANVSKVSPNSSSSITNSKELLGKPKKKPATRKGLSDADRKRNQKKVEELLDGIGVKVSG